MKHLAKDKGGKVVEDAEDKCEELMNTFNQHLRNKYDRYYYCFLSCEALNVFIVLCQLVLTNNFLGKWMFITLVNLSQCHNRRVFHDLRLRCVHFLQPASRGAAAGGRQEPDVRGVPTGEALKGYFKS